MSLIFLLFLTRFDLRSSSKEKFLYRRFLDNFLKNFLKDFTWYQNDVEKPLVM